ncbi:hypothetical protein [Streptomyces sp. NPDC020965]|uniref:hypothetical protein n=1 Tax=Streptomyces sp. NPDC020965 TaxID=3365105 RepID=UPI0037879E37
MQELAAAEGELAARDVIMPWLHASVAVVCAVLVWILPGSWTRPVAYASVLLMPLWGVVAASRLGRLAWLYTVPEKPAGDSGSGDVDDDEAFVPSPRAHVRALRATFAVIAVVGAAAVALVPAGWLRWALPVLALWAVAEVLRRSLGAYRRAREVCRTARDAPWYGEYRALIDRRRQELSTSAR